MSALTVTWDASPPMAMVTSHSFPIAAEALDFALGTEVRQAKQSSHGHGWLITS